MFLVFIFRKTDSQNDDNDDEGKPFIESENYSLMVSDYPLKKELVKKLKY